MQKLLLINGPNLGRLGRRKPEVYGSKTLATIVEETKALALEYSWNLNSFQSNHEGEIIDFIDENREASALIINPGALMMNGWALRDALEDFDKPWLEVHISNIWAREAFRHDSVLSPIADGVIAGMGTNCYTLAVYALVTRNTEPQN